MDPTQTTVTTPEQTPTAGQGTPAGQAPAGGTEATSTLETPTEQLAVEIERAGTRERMVPVAALAQEREARGKISAKLTETEGRLSQLEQQAQANAPLIQFLSQNPALLEQFQTGRLPARTEPSAEDQKAYELASTLGLYDTHGNPDVAAAKKVQAFVRSEAAAQVAPVQQSAAQRQSESHLRQLITARDENGMPIAREATIRQLWSVLPPELTADQGVAAIVADAARGRDFKFLAGQMRSAPEPLFSETSGGASPNSAPLSPAEEAARQARGLSVAEWHERTKNMPGSR